MVKQYGFYYNTDACTGCKGCVAACKDKNDSPVGMKFRKVYDNSTGSWEQTATGAWKQVNVGQFSVSISCMHCENPACVSACPSGAMHKTDGGIVCVDEDVCIGCGMCTGVCPYHEPRLDPVRGVSVKCDFCRDLLASGEPPACVASCQMRALDYGDIDELRRKYGEGADISPLPSSSLTGPNVVINASRFSVGESHVINPLEELI